MYPCSSILRCPGQSQKRRSRPPAVCGLGSDFPDPRAEADWIARTLRAQVVMVPEAGHYPQSQRPEITAAAALRNRSRAMASAGLIAATGSEKARRIAAGTAWGYCS